MRLLDHGTAPGSISGAATVDLPNQTLDWSLSVADHIDAAKASQLTEQTRPRFRFVVRCRSQ